MTSNVLPVQFNRCLESVLAVEGGFVRNRHDPGGATNKGITQRVYDSWRRRHRLPVRSVAVIDSDEVADIYYNQYWLTADCQLLMPGIDLCHFDTCVNSGPHEALLLLQRALGVRADGLLGQVTLEALGRADQERLIDRYCQLRLGFLHKLRTWKFFNRGWTARVDEIGVTAKGMLLDNRIGVSK